MSVATSLRLTTSALVLLVVTSGCHASTAAYRSTGTSSAPASSDTPAAERMAVRITVQGMSQVRWISARGVEDVLNGVPGLVATPRGTDDLTLRLWGRETPVMIDGVHALASDLLLLYPWELGEIEVLRDVPATAMYGSRGEGGIIRVTTKRRR